MHSDRLYFATHSGVPLDIFPEECGLLLSDGYDAEMIRDAPEHRLGGPDAQIRIPQLRARRGAAADAGGMVGGSRRRHQPEYAGNRFRRLDVKAGRAS